MRYDLLLSYCGPTLGTHWEHISNTLVRYGTIYYSPTAVRQGQNKWLGYTIVGIIGRIGITFIENLSNTFREEIQKYF